MELLTREGKPAETVEDKINSLVDWWKWEQEEKQREYHNRSYNERLEEAKDRWLMIGVAIGICIGVGFAVWLNTSPPSNG